MQNNLAEDMLVTTIPVREAELCGDLSRCFRNSPYMCDAPYLTGGGRYGRSHYNKNSGRCLASNSLTCSQE